MIHIHFGDGTDRFCYWFRNVNGGATCNVVLRGYDAQMTAIRTALKENAGCELVNDNGKMAFDYSETVNRGRANHLVLKGKMKKSDTLFILEESSESFQYLLYQYKEGGFGRLNKYGYFLNQFLREHLRAIKS